MSATRRRIDVRKAVGEDIPARHYATHGWDRYPAKMVPHLARYAIEAVSTPGDLVLDPFCGCGTVQIESLLTGRNSIGFDINPIAVLLATAKSSLYDVRYLTRYAERVIRAAKSRRRRAMDYPSWLDYWFSPATLHKLLLLRSAIDSKIGAVPKRYRHFLKASLGVSVRLCSRADPRSPKPFISRRARAERVGRHFDAFKIFPETVARLVDSSADLFRRLRDSAVRADTLCCDARTLALQMPAGSVDAVVTSPPYLSAQDYYRSSKLELAILGLDQEYGDGLPRQIIGSGRGPHRDKHTQEHTRSPRALRLLRQKDERSARIVLRYLGDMKEVFQGVHRVLRPGGKCCFIVGDSTLSSIRLPVHKWIGRIAEDAGFQLIRHDVDAIRDRRVPPRRLGHGSLIEYEHLLFFQRDR